MNVPYPYRLYGGEHGFVGYDRIDIQRGAGLDVDVVIDRDEPISAPEELALTATEADNRLLSRLLAQRVDFAGEGTREVTDILIDRETGEIAHWIVEMDEDAIFTTERRAIPAERISIEDGMPSAQLELATVDDLQEYDSQFL